MQFRKKPVIIDAWDVKELITNSISNFEALPEVVRNAYDDGKLVFLHSSIVIKTLEGDMRGDKEDKLICGVQGELYPCKPEIFAISYEVLPE